MKRTVFFVLLFISFFVGAQNSQNIDSVINNYHKCLVSNPEKALKILENGIILSEKKHDNGKKAIFLVKIIGQKGVVRDVKGAIKQFEVAKKYCIKTNNKLQYACANSELAEVFYNNEDLDLAVKYFKLSEILFAKANDAIGVTISKVNISDIYQLKGKYDLAISTLLNASKEIDTTQYTYIKVAVLNNISALYTKIKDNDKAILYSEEALQYALKDKKYPLDVFTCYRLLIDLFQEKKDFKKSELYLLKASKLVDSLSLEEQRFDLLKVKAQQNIGLNHNSEAKKNIEKALVLGFKYKRNSTEMYSLKSNLAKLYSQEGSQKESIKILLELLNEAKENQILLNIPAIYSDLAQSYFKDKNYKKAFEAQELFVKSNELNLGKEKQKFFKEAEVKFETAKKEKQLAEKQVLLLQKEIEAKEKNSYLIGLSILVLLIALIGFLIYRQQKQKNRQQAQEYKLKKAIIKIESQNKLQEQRLSISRDLHDNIGSQLTFIISSVDNIKYAFDITNQKLDYKLSNISSFARETIVELRDTIWAMNSNEISFEDLEIRINNYIEKAKEAKDQISFSFAIDPSLKTQKLTSVQGMNVYRTIQEAVNNSIKYANASVISINAKQVENQIKITIQDNGIGFDEATIQKGNGLQNMQKRIEEIGGSFELFSSNRGTEIIIYFINLQ